MKNKIVGIFLCTLLILSLYTVSANNVRIQDNELIQEVDNEKESNLVIIPYVHHKYYRITYRLNSSQKFICRVGNSGLSTEPSPPFTLTVNVYNYKGEFKTHLYTGDFEPLAIGGEINPVEKIWDIVEPAGLYYVEAKVQFSEPEYEPVFDRWHCSIIPREDSKNKSLKASSTSTVKPKLQSYNDNTLYVGGSGPNNYSTIQSAINDANPNDTVFVYDDSSPYYENVVVNKSIHLIGEDKETTIIDGLKNGNVVYVTSDRVSISGFTIMNSSVDNFHSYFGIGIHSNYTVISKNIIKNNFLGIIIGDLDVIRYGNVISDNIISSNSFAGINLDYCSDSNVSNNIFQHNEFSAIHLNFATENIISRNKISNNYNGLSLYQSSNNNEISNNNITHNQKYCIFIYDSAKNKILQNNFIESGKRNIKILYHFYSIKRNKWIGNYWNEPKTSPILIFGKISIWSIFGIIPWFEIDWNPAQEPYDIDI